MKLKVSFSLSIALFILLSAQRTCKHGDTGSFSETQRVNPVDSMRFEAITRLSPRQLSADLDGDGKAEMIFLIRNRQDLKEGICITELTQAKECVILGAGNVYFDVKDNLSWVQKWRIIAPGETFEITFQANGEIDGSRQVFLSNPGLGLYDEDNLGGIIAYREGDYSWIHQAH